MIRTNSVRVLIAPDKFKGTLPATRVAHAIAAGWKRARPLDELELLPITDGGDGFGLAMRDIWEAKTRRVRTVDAAGRATTARWWSAARNTAIIESAEIIGLAKLPPKRFHPFQLDTTGLAAVIRAASRAGAKRCVIGIGGSATNDGGFGMARGLGWRFFTKFRKPIEQWTQLNQLQLIEAPEEALGFREVVVAVDVRNPLLGRTGASRIYGPQKGLRPSDFAKADACLRRLALVVKKYRGRDFQNVPGAGAAGGLGFGLAAFLGARLEPGFELFARETRIEKKVQGADLVITGEGCVDRSTMMGKGVGQLAELCRKRGVPCILLGGKIRGGPYLSVFEQMAALSELASESESMRRPAYWLQRVARDVATRYSLNAKVTPLT